MDYRGGDLNCPGETTGLIDSALSDNLDACGLKQWVSGQTHDEGGLLDLVLTPAESSCVQNISRHIVGFSDHVMISANLSMKKTKPVKTRSTYRNFKKFDSMIFEREFLMSEVILNPADNVDDYMNQLEYSIKLMLDKVVPVRVSTRRRGKKSSPWLSEAATESIRERRRLERIWTRTRKETDRAAYRTSCRSTNKLITDSRSVFYADQINESSGDQKRLWKKVKEILHPNSSNNRIPPEINGQPSCQALANHFVNKVRDTVSTIATKLSQITPVLFREEVYNGPVLKELRPVTFQEMMKAIAALPMKTSPLDLLPTNILKSCAGLMAPCLVRMVNMSFTSGIFPSCLKTAQVTALLKKPGLDPDNSANYRPISNLKTVSKLMERLFLARLNPHLDSTGRMDPYQSAYKSRHSTETALLQVTGDLYKNIDMGNPTVLVSLDISAAFDSIDHQSLLNRMENYFGISGCVLNWIKSYLDHRKQFVKVDEMTSVVIELSHGVPQGSVLGPIYFSAFLAPLGKVIRSFDINHHQYADDMQIYHSFPSCDINNSNNLTLCLNAINSWYLTNGLLVIPGKSDALLIGSSAQRRKIDDSGVFMSGTEIKFSDSLRLLGVTLDSGLSLDKHVTNICRLCNYDVRSLRTIRPALTESTAETIGRSIVMSRIDYCNSLLAGASKKNIRRIQKIQNDVARVVTKTAYREHIKPSLYRLHWLPVKERIDFKLSTLVHKSINSFLPAYLSDQISFYQPSRNLRSSNQLRLNVPWTRTKLAERSFAVAASRIWNNLPLEITMLSSQSINIFKSNLKTHFFKIAYKDFIH